MNDQYTQVFHSRSEPAPKAGYRIVVEEDAEQLAQAGGRS